MIAITPKTPFIAIDGSAARSAHLLSKATHTVTPRLAKIWRDAYERNEALRASYAR